MIIGITGGSGCGKTTALNVIRDMGGLVLDCDAIYHRLLQEDPSLLKDIETRFPGTVESGQLQRKKLGNIVFSDENALSDLNKITHAAVKSEVLRQLEGHSGLVAIDAIGLFEGGLAALCQMTVAICARRKTASIGSCPGRVFPENMPRNASLPSAPKRNSAICAITLWKMAKIWNPSRQNALLFLQRNV